MMSVRNYVSSPAHSTGCAAHQRAPVLSTPKRKTTFRHEPYSSLVLITPSSSDILSPQQRAVFPQTSSSHLLSPQTPFVTEDVRAGVPRIVVTPTHRQRHHRASPSTISADSFESRLSPSNTASTTTYGAQSTSVTWVEDAEKLSCYQQMSRTASTVFPPCTYDSHRTHPHDSSSTSCVAPWLQPNALEATLPPQPAATAMVEPPLVPAGAVLLVSFKYGVKRFVATFPTRLHEMVVVEGDRGIDLGVVQDHLPLSAHGGDMGNGNLPKVLRRPTAQDTEMHRQRAEHEDEAVRVLRALCVEEGKGLNFSADAIVDVMLQLDNKKITLIIFRENNKFFFDFRTFQRQVFELYRCRVWFSYLDEIEQTLSTDNRKPPRGGKAPMSRRGKGKGPQGSGASANHNKQRRPRNNASFQ